MSGICVAVLATAGVVTALILPSFTERGIAFDGKGHLLTAQTMYQGFLDHVGVPVGVAMLALLGVLALGIAIVSLARGSHLSRGTLIFTWIFAAMLGFAAYAVSIVLGPRFWPSAVLAIVCAVLITVQYLRRSSVG